MLYKTTHFVTLLALLFGCHTLSAQQSAENGEPTVGKGFFMVGWQQLDVDDLNDRLNGNGFPSFSPNMLTIGGGGWATFGSGLVIGGEGHGLIGGKETTSDAILRSQLAGGYGMLNVGYRAYAGERMDVTPLVGFGVGALSMEVRKRGSLTFDDALADPLTGTSLSAGGFLFDVSAVAAVRVTGHADDGEGSAGGVSLGMRTGYAYSPADWDWKHGDVDVPGGPGMGVRGFYVRLMIGGTGSGLVSSAAGREAAPPSALQG